MPEEKKLGISFESADVYARSLGIQIEDYELIPIHLGFNYVHSDPLTKNSYGHYEMRDEMTYQAIIDRVYDVTGSGLIRGVRKFAEAKNLDYICSIKILKLNNTPELTATGLRRKIKTEIKTEIKTKSTPPLPIVIPSFQEGPNDL